MFVYLKRNKHQVEVKEINKEVGGKTYTYMYSSSVEISWDCPNISFKNPNVSVQCMTREKYEEWKNKDEEPKKDTAEAASKKYDE